jgi:hypothetical protein
MQDPEELSSRSPTPWNKGRLIGPKAPLRAKQVLPKQP